MSSEAIEICTNQASWRGPGGSERGKIAVSQRWSPLNSSRECSVNQESGHGLEEVNLPVGALLNLGIALQ